MSGWHAHREHSRPRRRVVFAPTTRLGRWAVGLAAAAVVGVPLWAILPGGALLPFGCGLAGGVVAVVAIARRHERAIAVYAALAPLAFVVLFVLAELLIGHS
jgi:hypothetical protein